MKKQLPPLPLNSLSFLLTRQKAEVTLSDINEAANTLTIDCNTIHNYLEGRGWDMVVAFDLIAFFQYRIQARS